MERLDVDLDITQERSEKATCTCELYGFLLATYRLLLGPFQNHPLFPF